MTRAVTLAEIADTNTFVVDGTNVRVGINSSIPTTTLDVGGAVKATSFTGDGSSLTGVASTDNIITGTAATFTSNVNISGITTVGVLTAYTSVTVGAAITADAASGIVTATTFSGALTGNVTGNASGSSGSCSGNSATATVATNAQGLTGTPDIAVRNITGVAATFTGVLTYEDVTNIDSIGIVTARTGIKVLAGGANIVGVTTAASGLVVSSGGINIVGGGATVAGIATFHDGADIEGFKVEDGQTAATPNGEFNFYLASGHFFRYTGTPGADYYPNFKHSASINLNDRMDVNDVVTATLAVNSPAVTYHIANTIHIDGNATGENSYTIDTDWIGGSAPSAGNGSGYDIYSFTIIKTADKNFTILANALAAA